MKRDPYCLLLGVYDAGFEFNTQTLTSGALGLNNTIPEDLKSHVWTNYEKTLANYGAPRVIEWAGNAVSICCIH